ncbi:hypothetical protein [Haloarcula rara]|uniref:hypothetical protein n=2 Tax=Haloarcula TaxID=2237 RepID=UPI0023E84B68|nr:hypothetical protein [Halomicroarcula sp. SHR3]
MTNLRKAIQKPKLAVRELNLRYYRVSNQTRFNDDGLNFIEEDWDNMLLLDACRFDMFSKFSNISGELSKVQSSGSCTIEFLHANIANQELHDTVYVTANPVYHRNRDELNAEFHDVINVWQEDGWDDEYGTVLPETTSEYARKAAKKYPNKRLLVHYIQPHYPFIGSDTSFDKQQLHTDPDQRTEDQIRFWFRIFIGSLDISPNVVWEAYNSNLRPVLSSVKDLLDDLSGRTIVTADHGNLVAERAFPIPIHEWGHPCGLYHSKLVNVPWLVVTDGFRKSISAEPPKNKDGEINSATVENRLNDLGYL